MKKIIAIILLSIMLFVPITDAQNSSRKLMRGAINSITGWAEIPKNIYETTVEETLARGLTIGTVAGIGMAVIRTGCGLYEVVTFTFPIPEGYAPILTPEFVFENEVIVITERAENKVININE